MNKAIFLDRDDTIIVDKNYLNNVNDLEYFYYTFEAIKIFSSLGFKSIIVTNQSGVARGLVSEGELVKIHQQIYTDFKNQGLEILDILYCPYLPESNHPWRKPNPGMILEAQKRHKISLSESWMIGDRESDIEAGLNANCKTILLTFTNETIKTKAHYQSDTLLSAARLIMKLS